MEFIDSIIEKEISKLPEKERELLRQRFIGRKVELRKLVRLLKEDKIKDMSKEYFRKINTQFDYEDDKEYDGDKLGEDNQTT